MLQNLKQLYGRQLSACDGPLGWIHDFYFDDVTWTIRYVVADTGGWLPDRQVLFPVTVFENFPLGRKRASGGVLHLNTDRKRLASGPCVAAGERFTPELENQFVRHHQLPAYWAAEGPPEPLLALPSARLHRTRGVTGYRVRAMDDVAGMVGGFHLTARSWSIAQIAIETGSWFFGRQICVRPSEIEQIDPANRLMHVNGTAKELHEAARERKRLEGSVPAPILDPGPAPRSTVH